VSRARTAIRGRLGRAVVAAVAALVLPVLPASCPCAGATIAPMGAMAPAARGGCHGHSEAPRPSRPDRVRDCAHCQVAVASSPGQQTLSPPASTSRPIVAGQVSMSSRVPAVRGAPTPRRASRPPARTILLAKRVLLL